MLAAARKHKRVVQVGTQRRSTPHLIEARDRIIKRGQARQDRPGRDLLLLPHAGRRATRPTRTPPRLPRLRDVDRPGADAAVQRARPPAQLAGVHGIRQRHRRRHVHPHARHGPLDARPRLAEARSARPAASSSTRRARRTSPTRRPRRSTSATCRSSGQHRTWGDAPDPKYPWGATFYGDKGTLKASVDGLRLHPAGQGRRRSTRTSTYELEQYPEDKTEKDLEKHVAPAIRGHMKDFLAAHRSRAASRSPTSSRATSRRRAASWPTCRMQLGRSLTWDHAKGSRSSATTRPTRCSAAPTAHRGCIRIRRQVLESDRGRRASLTTVTAAPARKNRPRSICLILVLVSSPDPS